MKTSIYWLFGLLIIMLLCVSCLPAPDIKDTTPTAIFNPTPTETQILTPSDIMTNTASPSTIEKPSQTETPIETPTQTPAPTPTATPTPTSTSTATPTPIVLFEDQFLSNLNMWIRPNPYSATLDDYKFTKHIHSSRFNLELECYKNSRNCELFTKIPSDLNFKDFELKFTIFYSKISTNSVPGICIYFREINRSNLYQFCIDSEGKYITRIVQNNNWVALLEKDENVYNYKIRGGWNEAKHYFKGVNVENHITIAAKGPEIAIYVNGNNVANYEDGNFEAGIIEIGLYTKSDRTVKMYIDSIIISEIPTATSVIATATADPFANATFHTTKTLKCDRLWVSMLNDSDVTVDTYRRMWDKDGNVIGSNDEPINHGPNAYAGVGGDTPNNYKGEVSWIIEFKYKGKVVSRFDGVEEIDCTTTETSTGTP